MQRPARVSLTRRGDLFDVSYKLPDGFIWPGAESQKSYVKANEATEALLKLLQGKTVIEFSDGETECSWTDLATGKRPPAPVEKKE